MRIQRCSYEFSASQMILIEIIYNKLAIIVFTISHLFDCTRSMKVQTQTMEQFYEMTTVLHWPGRLNDIHQTSQ
jgi:hypothetical protein